jgi:hypothetical protein
LQVQRSPSGSTITTIIIITTTITFKLRLTRWAGQLLPLGVVCSVTL